MIPIILFENVCNNLITFTILHIFNTNDNKQLFLRFRRTDGWFYFIIIIIIIITIIISHEEYATYERSSGTRALAISPWPHQLQ